MARKTKKPMHHTEPPENVQVCLTCKRARCNGNYDCMRERKREMQKKGEIR